MQHRTFWASGVVSCIVAVSGVSCGGTPEENPTGTTRAALSQSDGAPTLYLWLDAPSAAYPSQVFTVGAEVDNLDVVPVADVTLTTSVSGSFELGPLYPYSDDGSVTCALVANEPGAATVECHAAELAWFGGMMLEVTPTAEGSIATTATVSAGGVPIMSDRRVTSVASADSADLSIWGWAPGQALLGQTATASFYANNRGPLPATGVNVAFHLSGPGEFASVAPSPWSSTPGSCSFEATSATCSVPEFAVYGYLPFDVQFLPTGEGTVSVTATISGAEPDPSLANNTTTATSAVVRPAVADLKVAMTAPNHPVALDRALTYLITVSNQGPDAASSVDVYDPLPSGVTVVSATASQGTCWGAEWGVLDCELGQIPGAGSATIELVVEAAEPATLTNTVSVSNYAYSETDPDYTNNSASATVRVVGADPNGGHEPPNKGGCGLWPGVPIDNLEDGDLFFAPDRKGSWFIFADGTGTQVPATVDGLVVPGGPGRSRYMVHSSGEGFSLWGAGFGASLGCVYDVSRFRGVRFQAKAGGAGRFLLEVATIEIEDAQYGGHCTSNCNDFYSIYLSLPADSWYECTVPFTDLRQVGWGMQAPFDVGAVMTVQFNFELAHMPYDLAVDNLAFVPNPPPRTTCVPIGG